MGKQHFTAPVVHVAGQDIHVHHYWPETAPPDDPAMSVQCWQCRRLTWRHTARCVHCQVLLSRGWLVRLLNRESGG
ncbi:MAG TPA: hypothetical protein PLF63_04810 [Rubrivivax sp.]|jgi:hypothetical protein|nr:hypothetical protein [Rubrivivax sp.]